MSLTSRSGALTLGKSLTWRLLIALALSLIGLFVGAACVILPIAIPAVVIAVAGLIYLWVMPDRKVASGKIPRFGVYVFIVSVLSVPSYYTIVVPGVPWISLRRVALLVFVISTCLTISTSSKHRAILRSYYKQYPILATGLIGLLILWVVSIPGSVALSDSISFLVNQCLIWLLVLVAVLLFIRTLRDVEVFILICTACALFDFVIGLIEYELRQPYLVKILPAYMRDQILRDNPYLIVLLYGGGYRNGQYRALSIFNVTLSWGEMAAILAPFGVYLAFHAKSILGRSWGMLTLIACFGSIYCSGSRGGMVAFLVSLAFYAVLAAFRAAILRPQTLTGSMSVIVVCMLTFGVLGSVLFVGRVNKAVLGGGATQSSTDSRAIQWSLAKPHLAQRPIVGYGVGQAARVVNYSPTFGSNVSLDSYLITLLIDMGWPGLIFYMGSFIYLIVICGWKFVYSPSDEASLLGPIGSAMLAYAVYRTTLSQIDNNFLIFAIAGLAVVCLDLERRRFADLISTAQVLSTSESKPTQDWSDYKGRLAAS